MTDQRKDQWIRQYESAALGLLMEEYADTEGGQVLLELETAGRQGDAGEMPEAVDAKCRKLIDRVYKRSRRRQRLCAAARTGGRIALVALVCFSLLSATVLSVDAFRAPVLNFILEHTDRYTSVNFGETEQKNQGEFEQLLDLASRYIPQGYQLVNSPATDKPSLDLRFQEESGKLILIYVCDAGSSLQIDTEDAQCIEMDLAGHTALLVQKEGLQILWHNEAQGLVYQVYANGLTADQFWLLVNALAEQ